MFDEAESLAPVAQHLSKLLGMDVPLKRDWLNGVEVEPGSVVLLENCRFNKGEKKNDEALSKKMAALCDVYVNDAFGTAHRAEATTHGIARFAKVACAGPLMAAEIDALGRALEKPARPLVAIVGGSKVSTKLTILACARARKSTSSSSAAASPTRFCSPPASRSANRSPSPSSSTKRARSRHRSKAKGGAVPIPIDVVCAKEFAATARARDEARRAKSPTTI